MKLPLRKMGQLAGGITPTGALAPRWFKQAVEGVTRHEELEALRSVLTACGHNTRAIVDENTGFTVGWYCTSCNASSIDHRSWRKIEP